METQSPDSSLNPLCDRSDSGVYRFRATAILTSYNRRANTLECLARLELAARRASVKLDAVLVDDGSTDGTAEAVTDAFRWVTLERGDGSLFWNRGMHRAQAIAMRREVDFLIWINDDTWLSDDALRKLTHTYEVLIARLGQPVIVVGATSDRATGALTYGGQVAASRLRRFTYHKVWSATEPTECETMNGNLVLLPIDIARVVGNLDPVYEHAAGDIDYALRARKAGYRVFVAPGFVGNCSNNPRAGTFLDPTLPFAVRWKKMMSRKGLPPRSWLQLTRKHGGPVWLIYFIWPYFKLIIDGVCNRPTLSRKE